MEFELLDFFKRCYDKLIFFNLHILFFCACCKKKAPHNFLNKTTEMYSLTAVEVKNSKSVSLDQSQGDSRTGLPSEALGDNLYLNTPASVVC